MNRWKASVGGLLATTAITAGSLLVGGGASAGCVLFGYDPVRSGDNVSSTGGRSGCSTSVDWVEVSLRKQRNNLPDINIATNRKDTPDPTNVTLTATKTHVDPLTARTRVRSSTGAQYETAWQSGT